MSSKDRLSGLSVEDLLKETENMLKSLEKKTCRRCRKQKQIYESGFCQECWEYKQAERQKKRDETVINDNGYERIYVEDKLVYRHKYLMEIKLGRPLTKREVVLHRDGNTMNNDLSNLMLGMKNGTPMEWLVCDNCSCRGAISIVPLPEQLPPEPT